MKPDAKMVPMQRFKIFFDELSKEGYEPQEIFSSLMAISLRIVDDLVENKMLDTDEQNPTQVIITFESKDGDEPQSIIFNLGKEYYPSQEDQ